MPSPMLCGAEGHSARHSEEETNAAGSHNHGPFREGRSDASSLSGARNRPRRSAGGVAAPQSAFLT